MRHPSTASHSLHSHPTNHRCPFSHTPLTPIQNLRRDAENKSMPTHLHLRSHQPATRGASYVGLCLSCRAPISTPASPAESLVAWPRPTSWPGGWQPRASPTRTPMTPPTQATSSRSCALKSLSRCAGKVHGGPPPSRAPPDGGRRPASAPRRTRGGRRGRLPRLLQQALGGVKDAMKASFVVEQAESRPNQKEIGQPKRKVVKRNSKLEKDRELLQLKQKNKIFVTKY